MSGYAYDDCTVKVDLFEPFRDDDEDRTPVAVAGGPTFHGDCPLNDSDFEIFDGGVEEVGEHLVVGSSAWEDVDQGVKFKGLTTTHGSGFPFTVTFPCDIMDMTDQQGNQVSCDDLKSELES